MTQGLQSRLWVQDWEGMLASVLENSHRAPSKERCPLITGPRFAAQAPAYIFVVDDEPVIASTLAAILRLNGYQAAHFSSPIEALFAAQSGPPNLLISDVMMPDLSGIELAISITRDAPDCKVLLFSGQANRQDLLERARGDGHHFELLQKPVQPSVILARVEKLTSFASNRSPSV